MQDAPAKLEGLTMGKPNLSGDKGESPRIVIRLRQQLYDAVLKAAKKDGRNLSDFIRLTLEDRVKGGKL